MELITKSKLIKSFKDYIKLSEEACNLNKMTKIKFSMSSIAALERIQNFEIEYFHKYSKNGIACLIFEQILTFPNNQPWTHLSQELILILKSWLNAMTTQIVSHNENWWIFMKKLLTFIKIIRRKGPNLPTIIAEHLTDCLLDLATKEKPNVWQKFEILHCSNLYASECSKEVRLYSRRKYEKYFIKLSAYMANCSHVPCQISILETLLRWLIPRNDTNLRISCANSWFSNKLYPKQIVDVFVQKAWMNFHQDARDFLNIINETSGKIVSVLCKKVTIGQTEIISAIGQQLWLDINLKTNCITLVLLPRILQSLIQMHQYTFETLVFRKETTDSVVLLKKSSETVLLIRTSSPPTIEPSLTKLFKDECSVIVVLNFTENLNSFDSALKTTFGDKYRLDFDLNTDRQSQENTSQIAITIQASISKMSLTQPDRHARTGIKAWKSKCRKSPSSVSTTSLKYLRDELREYPAYNFPKDLLRVSKEPEFPEVLELDETNQDSIVTTKFSTYGVKASKPKAAHRNSPVLYKRETSCLLAATLGTNEDSVINDILERISKHIDYTGDNVVDLVIQEALESNETNKVVDGVVSANDKTPIEQNVAINKNIEKVPVIEGKNRNNRKNFTIISKSTSEESNIDIIAPSFVSVRSKKINVENDLALEYIQGQILDENLNLNFLNEELKEALTYNDLKAKSFFNQHTKEIDSRKLVTSTTLARTINISSSKCSGDLAEELRANNPSTEDVASIILSNNRPNINETNPHINLKEVEECLYKIIENVLVNEQREKEFESDDDIPLGIWAQNTNNNNKQNMDIVINSSDKVMSSEKDTGENETKGLINDNVNLNTKNLSIHKPEIQSGKTSLSKNDLQESRRKRKLYSPKYDDIHSKTVNEDPVEDNLKISKSQDGERLKVSNRFYKDIDSVRKARTRAQCKRRSRPNEFDPPSPKTAQRNRVFDRLKRTIDNVEKPVYVDRDKYEIYNFQSDSDDDFDDKKKFNMGKMKKANDSTATSKRKNNTKTSNNSEVQRDITKGGQKNSVRKRRTVTKRMKNSITLIDEKMREATKEALNTSVTAEKLQDVSEEPELILVKAPEMELAADETNKEMSKAPNKKKIKNIKATTPTAKIKVPLDTSYRTESPLPELFIEPDTRHRNSSPDILLDNILNNINSISNRVLSFNDTQSLIVNETLGRETPIQENNDSNKTEVKTKRNNVPRVVLEPLDNVRTTNIEKSVQQIQDIEESVVRRTKNKLNNSPMIVNETLDCINVDDERSIQNNQDLNKKYYVFDNEKKSASDNTKNVKTDRKRSKLHTVKSQLPTKQAAKQKSKQKRPIAEKLDKIDDIQEICDKSGGSTKSVEVRGGLDVSPISFSALVKTMKSRNLHIDLFDDTIKEYNGQYGQVGGDRGVNSSQSSVNGERYKEMRNEKIKIPFVSLKNMSLEDIHKYLPSSRNSSEDSNSVIESDDSNKSEFSKWLSQRKHLANLEKPHSEAIVDNTTAEKRRRHLNESELNDQCERLSIDDRESNKELANIFKNPQEIASVPKKSLTLKFKLNAKHNKSDDSLSGKSRSIRKKKTDAIEVVPVRSTISPIKNFDGITFDTNFQLEENVNKSNSGAVSYIKNNKEQIKFQSPKSIRELAETPKSTSTPIRYTKISSFGTSTRNTLVNESNEKTMLPDFVLSSSSVHDWLENRQDKCGDGAVHVEHIKDALNILSENCDKSLHEINHETSRRLELMMTEIQAGLTMQHQQQKNEMKKIEDQLTVKLSEIQEQFAALQEEMRSKIKNAITLCDKTHKSFVEAMKNCGKNIITNDIKKKELMIKLTKQDIDAVLTYIEKQKR